MVPGEPFIASQIVFSLATSPSGKARVCKTLIMGSNPIVASKKDRIFSGLFVFYNLPGRGSLQAARSRDHGLLVTCKVIYDLFNQFVYIQPGELLYDY